GASSPPLPNPACSDLQGARCWRRLYPPRAHRVACDGMALDQAENLVGHGSYRCDDAGPLFGAINGFELRGLILEARVDLSSRPARCSPADILRLQQAHV